MLKSSLIDCNNFFCKKHNREWDMVNCTSERCCTHDWSIPVVGAELSSLSQRIRPPQFLGLQPLLVPSLPLAWWCLTVWSIHWMHPIQGRYVTLSLNQGSNPIWKINLDLHLPCRMHQIRVGSSFQLLDLISDHPFQILALSGLSLRYHHLWTSSL